MKKLILISSLLIFACTTDSEGNPCIYEPTLTTEAVTDITETSATLNGVISIVSENCDVPNNTEQGFVYSTEIQPTTDDIQVNVNGTNISTNVEGLEPNTTYYVRSFLTNAFGEFYGNEVSFTTDETDVVPPILNLLGDNPLFITQYEEYIEPGATAVDETDGDLTNQISINSAVNTSLVGVYSVIYSVSDYSGNETEAIREVVVEAANAVYLGENGVTVFAKDWAQVGDSGTINDNEYVIVDRNMLDDMIDNSEDISLVCTSRINDMSYTFYGINFNQDISSWDVSNVTNMSGMFRDCFSFNQDITYWDVGNVINMSGMFREAAVFNQPIGNWDVSNVTNMSQMFFGAYEFNQSIGDWDVSNVTSFDLTFGVTTEFNQDIGDWDLSSAVNISSMFQAAISFNQDISSWDVSNVTNMEGLFSDAREFNQDIGGWDVSNVTNMDYLFTDADDFNQDIGSWDVSSVTTMRYMFLNNPGGIVSFNQDISSWDVSNVTNMEGMFREAGYFNQDLSTWDVDNVNYCWLFSYGAGNWTLPKPDFYCDTN